MPDGEARRRTQAVGMAPLARHVGFLLRLAQLQVSEEFHRALAAEGMTPARYSVLVLLGGNPDAQQGRLAEALRIKPSNMAVLVAELEAQALVERRPDNANRRACLLRLSAAGAALLDRLTPLVEAVEQRVAQRLSAAEFATLAALLAKMCPP